MRRLIPVLLGLTTVAPAAWSYPTSLNFIPVAAILAHREASIQGYGYHDGDHWTSSLGFQVGLFDKVELGVDYEDRVATWNAKAVVAEQPDKWALAVGLFAPERDKVQPYVVGQWSLSPTSRLHIGAIDNGRNRLFVGFDMDIDDETCFMIDMITGPDEATSLGLCRLFGESLELTVSASVPHQTEAPVFWQVSLAYTVKF